MFRVKSIYSRFSSIFVLSFQIRQRASCILSNVKKNKLHQKLLWIPATSFVLSKTLFHPFGLRSYALEMDSDFLQDVIGKADTLYSSNDYLGLYNFLKEYDSTTSVEVLWRLCRATRDFALKDSSLGKDKKKELHYEAFELAKQALKSDENHFASHKWFAITIGDIGDYEGLKAKIKNAFLIREHFERAIELNPNDATTIYCLGMWCFTFADMPGWQHRIASYMFETPPSSSYKEALGYFQQAEKVDPNFYSTNLLMLGKVHWKIGDKRRALLYLDKTIKYPAANDEDYKNQVEAQKIIDQIVKESS